MGLSLCVLSTYYASHSLFIKLVIIILFTDFLVRLNNITHVKLEIFHIQSTTYTLPVLQRLGRIWRGRHWTLILGRGKHICIKVGKSTAYGETNLHEVEFIGLVIILQARLELLILYGIWKVLNVNLTIWTFLF